MSKEMSIDKDTDLVIPEKLYMKLADKGIMSDKNDEEDKEELSKRDLKGVGVLQHKKGSNNLTATEDPSFMIILPENFLTPTLCKKGPKFVVDAILKYKDKIKWWA